MGLSCWFRAGLICKRAWDSVGGHRGDFMVGRPLTVAAVLSCKVLNDRWIATPSCCSHLI